MGDMVTLGDYKRLDNIDEIVQGFQLVSLVLFDIKHSILARSKGEPILR